MNRFCFLLFLALVSASSLTNGQVVPLGLGNIALDRGTEFKGQLEGPNGAEIYVESSEDLRIWNPLTFEILHSGASSFVDTIGAQDKRRFYRLARTESALFGAVDFHGGPAPELVATEYRTQDGKLITTEDALSGWVQLVVDPLGAATNVQDAVAIQQGRILSKAPRLGLYLVEVPPGSVAAFIDSMRVNWWVEAAFPATLPTLGAKGGYSLVMDWNSEEGSYCGRNHMFEVKRLAEEQDGRVVTQDVEKLAADATKLALQVIANLHHAAINDMQMVINLSLQSTTSGTHEIEKGTFCATSICHSVREAQLNFLTIFFKAMEEAVRSDPKVGNAGLITIIAGNAGVDLDGEVDALKRKYPLGFERIQIVGGSTTNQAVDKSLNHLAVNKGGEMVYAPAKEVGLGRCSGTSFAAPKIAGALDRLWSSNRVATSAQALKAFRQAVVESNPEGVLPVDENGKIPDAFFARAAELLRGGCTTPLAGKWKGTYSVQIHQTGCPDVPMVIQTGEIETSLTANKACDQVRDFGGKITGVVLESDCAATASYSDATITFDDLREGGAGISGSVWISFPLFPNFPLRDKITLVGDLENGVIRGDAFVSHGDTGTFVLRRVE